ncbi:MAG: hypothetical protein ACC657_16395, partial [Thiohalomonadales bacterium]
PNELLALLNGLAEIRIEMLDSKPIDAQQLFATVDKKSKDGSLANEVNQGSVYYEASKTNSGLLDCVQEDGSRQAGYFRDGKFKPK